MTPPSRRGSRLFAAVALLIGSIAQVDAGRIGDNHRQLQGGPSPPELTFNGNGNKFDGNAKFYQGGQKYIRLFKDDCVTKFADPAVEFKYLDNDGVETDTTNSVIDYSSPASPAESDLDFTLPLDDLHEHLSGDNDGTVTVCIQLESVNTLKNFIRTITLDLTDSVTVLTVEAKQPGADIGDVTVNTDVTAWVCDNANGTPDSSSPVTSVEVPGKIYVCIETTDGFQIESGALEATSAYTNNDPDENIVNYMALTAGETDTWSAENTVQVLKPSLCRVSIVAPSTWAPTATTANPTGSSTLTIEVTAQFDPVRRLATVSAIASDESETRHLRTRRHEDQDLESPFHWGRLPESTLEDLKLGAGMVFASPTATIQAMEIATASTTVSLVRGPTPTSPPTSPVLSTPAPSPPKLGDKVGNEPKPLLPRAAIIGGAVGGVCLLSFMVYFLQRNKRDD